MIEIKYVNSAGTTLNLLSDSLRVKDGNFHIWEWDLDVTEYQNGVTVNSFRKKPVTYNTTLTLRGTLSARKRQLNVLHDIFEYDIYKKSPGTLYFGNSYIKCFIKSSDSHISDDLRCRTDVIIDIYCPYPFWIQEKHFSILPLAEVESEDSLSYPYQYSYTYPLTGKNTQLSIEHYKESDFRMIIYGPTTEVNIYIGDNLYMVDYPVESGEYMVIDSRKNQPSDRRCYLVKEDGSILNVFNYRNSEVSIFEKIPAGNFGIYYNRNHGIDLTVFVERSEPEWI